MKYLIKLNNKIISRRNTVRTYNYGWVRVVQKEETTLTIDKKYIVYICDARDEVVDNYTKIFSTIETPSKKLIL